MADSEQIVYISCLKEVRFSFVSHLFEALYQKGISDVTVDSEDQLSEETRDKVERARVAVMVLPGNSTVFLDKLKEVLKFQKNKDQVVVPVLYGVSSLQSDWLGAQDLRGLTTVHRSSKECSDSKLVNEIVGDVYEKLFYLERIGIYSKLLEIEKMVNKKLSGNRCVGIWGMPGIGKTTLAKAYFDQNCDKFDAYCFFEDYDKVIHEKGLYRFLEEQFLEEKPGDGSTITKVSLLRDKLNNKRVLVVLDDVCNPLAAESFLGGFDLFGPESLLIITSRDKQVFRLCGVNKIYEVQGLNEKDALQLFSLCISRNDMAEQDLYKLSTEVIKYAQGNPLAFNIYGRELKREKKLSEMNTAFLKRRPPSEVVDAIKRSYDTLSDSEKNIFLDIACFFNRENVDSVMHLLAGCGFFPHVGIDVLVWKSLVTVSENRVWMHNLVQDVGREIINEETDQIERRSRLWEPLSIIDLLEHKANVDPKTAIKRAEGTEDIEGMFLDTLNLSFVVKPTAFENMLNLRLLKIYCSKPKIHPIINFSNGSLHSLPSELRLLHWENYPTKDLPQKFDPRNLVEINMPYSQLETLWGGTKKLEMLRTIKLCHSQKLENIDELLKAKNLEVIDLKGCTKLQNFPATGQLLRLRDVNLSGCTKMINFPDVPPNIEKLHLQGTAIIKLPIVKKNGGELVSLSEFLSGFLSESQGLSDALKVEYLTNLMKSSSSCQDLGKLICLELKDCSHLQSLPNMVNLELLRVLDLSGCSEFATIQGFPRNLKELNIAGTAVGELPKLPQSLELLNAHCSFLRNLPDMVNLELLRVLDLSGCSELATIQGFPRNLKELNIAGTAVGELPQLPQSLELLNAQGCGYLKELNIAGTAVTELPQLPQSLQLLYAHGCVNLKSFSLDSEKLPMHYTFSNCVNLSPQVVNNFLVKALAYVKDMPREHQQEINKALAFSFCAPSHADQNSTLGLQPGNSVMTRLNPSWRKMLAGFAVLVEVEFSEDYCDVTGLEISCVCRWKTPEGTLRG